MDAPKAPLFVPIKFLRYYYLVATTSGFRYYFKVVNGAPDG